MTEPLRVLAPNPSFLTGEGTNTYLVGEEELACIDPGPDDPAHLEAILRCAATRGRIVAVLLTHSHPDHRPLAAALSRHTGAPVRCLDPGREPDGALPLVDGERVEIGGVTLEAVHTPGHAADHLCFLDAASRAVYTGDHVLSGMTTVIAPPDGDMADYLASLERLRGLRPAVLHPGHGPRVDDAPALLDAYVEHRLAREAEIVRHLDDMGDAAPDDLVPLIYAGYPQELWPFAALSVRAHLDKLVSDGRAQRREHSGGPRYELGSAAPRG